MSRKDMRKLKKRFKVEARIEKFGYIHDDRHEKCLSNVSVLLKNIEIKTKGSEKIYIHHSWLKLNSNKDFPEDLKTGSIISFSAERSSYNKYKSRSYKSQTFGFKNFRLTEILREGKGDNLEDYCERFNIKDYFI